MRLPNVAAIVAAAGLLVLAGCGSAPPAPADRFYRLQTPAPVQLREAVVLRSVRAESLYAERPIVFVRSDDPRQLRQYHYHLWLYPPAQAVREHLAAGVGNGADKSGVQLDVRIAAFERVLDGGASKAHAALDVTATSAAGALLFEKRFQATQAANDESFSAFAGAMEQALQRIYGELAQDLSGARARR